MIEEEQNLSSRRVGFEGGFIVRASRALRAGKGLERWGEFLERLVLTL